MEMSIVTKTTIFVVCFDLTLSKDENLQNVEQMCCKKCRKKTQNFNLSVYALVTRA